MSNYKISIIIPVFNAEKHLKDSLNSIIDQSIGVENLEVIIVNDASTDSSKSIIDEYCLKYPCFKAVHLTENIGAAYGPRNVGLDKVTSDYIMFLDADDTLTPHACKSLYDEIISNDADVVFGRYYRVYDEIKLESYSPYSGGVNDISFNPKFNKITSFIWSKIIYRILYGKSIEKDTEKIYIPNINENPEILKILPSLWTRIVKKSVASKFPELITGEDLNFNLDTYSKSKILFLNNVFITNYYMRFDEDLSITKNVTFKLVYDSIRAYKLAVLKCRKYDFKNYSKMINPFLINYINLLKQSKLSDEEKRFLSEEISELDDVYDKRGLTGSLLVFLIRILSR